MDVTSSYLNSKKHIIRQKVINFKRKRVSSENDQEQTEIEENLIYLDDNTALEPESLTVEIRDEDDQNKQQKKNIFTELIDVHGQKYILENSDIIAEELEDGQNPLDDLELEEGEIRGANMGLVKKRFHNDLNRAYPCPVCDRTFSQKGNLIRHYQTHIGNRPFECELCGHKFTQKSNLQKHIATHNGDKRFQCGECKKCFVQKANLIRHLRIHTGEKPFQCDLCGHKFTQKGNLNKHVLLHSAEGEAVCDHCNSRFSSYSAKMRHESTVHTEKWKEYDNDCVNRQCRCDECPAVFKTVKALMKHKRFHD